MKKSALMASLMLCAGLSGCTTAPNRVGLQTLSQEDGLLKTDDRKRQDPNASLMYELLAAELAGQRGDYQAALDGYLRVAQQSHDPRVAERAMQIALYLKKPEQALNAATLWLKHEPESRQARKIAAFLSLRADHLEDARLHMKSLLVKADAEIESILVEMVRVLDGDVEKNKALSFMKALATDFPSSAEVRYAYALLATQKNEYDLALEQVAVALELQPDSSRVRLLQAQVLTQMGDSEGAKQALRSALQRDSKNTRLQLIYAQLLMKMNNYQEAEQQLHQVLQREPVNEDALFALAMTLAESGQEQKARRFLAELNDSPKWRMQAYFYQGLLEAKRNNSRAALAWFEKVASGPLAFEAQVNAITALINLKQMDEAREHLRRARVNNPSEIFRLYMLEGELLTRAKDYQSAFDILAKALEELPGRLELLYARALVAEQLDRIDVLEADLQAILKERPEDANALNALGYTLADRTDRLDEARGYLERALALKPDDPAVLDSYGWLQFRLGHYDEALAYLKKAYAQVPDAEIASHIGVVFWESGRRAEARKVWREALKKQPDSEHLHAVKQRYPDAW